MVAVGAVMPDAFGEYTRIDGTKVDGFSFTVYRLPVASTATPKNNCAEGESSDLIGATFPFAPGANSSSTYVAMLSDVVNMSPTASTVIPDGHKKSPVAFPTITLVGRTLPFSVDEKTRTLEP